MKLLPPGLKLRLMLNTKGKAYFTLKGTKFLRINGIKESENLWGYLYASLLVLKGKEGAVLSFYLDSWGPNTWFLELATDKKTFAFKLSHVSGPVVEGGSDIFKQVFVWEGTCLQYIKAVEDMLAAYKADPKRVALQ
ncbi:hypothetical protein LPB86_16235 [Pedobacter sp. MC2016-14]|uniref:hypothetical protein n=1 Tax=Pedobacter sp. MC2016-14 TaxID=2897327 RepID=UPI001E3F6944|nr:hypothetical protein [Pedobacter sp. MC2016-14]MCD0489793.1 hypothetical protein [Pedobacter sp. MC2016-14]